MLAASCRLPWMVYASPMPFTKLFETEKAAPGGAAFSKDERQISFII
jgi:hypothetical protein